jgi:hypothetical protein
MSQALVIYIQYLQSMPRELAMDVFIKDLQTPDHVACDLALRIFDELPRIYHFNALVIQRQFNETIGAYDNCK